MAATKASTAPKAKTRTKTKTKRTLVVVESPAKAKTIEKYLGKKKGYKKNQYKYDDRTVQIVEENWGMALKEWGYSL